MTKMTRSDWMARAEAANQAAARWAQVAQQHEEVSRRDPWAKSNMTAMDARNNEARCQSAADHAKEMACDVR